jgi:hypothetical protein
MLHIETLVDAVNRCLMPAWAAEEGEIMVDTQDGSATGIAPCNDAAIGELSVPLRERLAAEGVFTLRDWVALGRRRRELFGVTATTVRQLDALARGGGQAPAHVRSSAERRSRRAQP